MRMSYSDWKILTPGSVYKIIADGQEKTCRFDGVWFYDENRKHLLTDVEVIEIDYSDAIDD